MKGSKILGVIFCAALTAVMLYLIITGVQKGNGGIIDQHEISKIMDTNDPSEQSDHELIELNNGTIVYKNNYNRHKNNNGNKAEDIIQFGPTDIKFGK